MEQPIIKDILKFILYCIITWLVLDGLKWMFLRFQRINFLSFNIKKMNWITILGYVIIAIGTLGGSLLVWYGSTLSTNKDKEEILTKIEDTNKRLSQIQVTAKTVEQKEEIKRISDEFTRWAESFEQNKEKIKIDQERLNVDLKTRELELSKQWQPLYEYTFSQLKKYLDAYNENKKEKIYYTIPEVPKNLYSEESKNWNAKIIFKYDALWLFKLRIREPLQKDEIPTIMLHVLEKDIKDTSELPTFPEVYITFSLKSGIIYFDRENEKFKIRDAPFEYELKNGKKSLDDILRLLLEYQLSKL